MTPSILIVVVAEKIFSPFHHSSLQADAYASPAKAIVVPGARSARLSEVMVLLMKNEGSASYKYTPSSTAQLQVHHDFSPWIETVCCWFIVGNFCALPSPFLFLVFSS